MLQGIKSEFIMRLSRFDRLFKKFPNHLYLISKKQALIILITIGLLTYTAILHLTLNIQAQTSPTPIFRSVSSASTGATKATSVSVNIPSGVTDNDILIAQVTTYVTTANITPPAGWNVIGTKITNDTGLASSLFWKKASSEVGPYVWNFDTSTYQVVTVLDYYNTSDLTAGNYESSSQIQNSNQVTASQLTTSTANEMLIYFGEVLGNTTITVPTNMTGRTGSAGGPQIADQIINTAGPTGTRTGVAGITGSNIGQLLAIKPIAIPTPTPTPTPTQIPTPTPPPTPTSSSSTHNVIADTASFRTYMTGIQNTLEAQADTIEYGSSPAPTPPAGNSLVTYPGPPGITPSDLYTVTISVSQGAPYIFNTSFVYKVIAQQPPDNANTEADTSWTTYSFSGSSIVQITKTGTTIQSCAIRPDKYAIPTTIINNRCYFVLSSPKNVSVEINGDKIHPMLVFANPPEVAVPVANGINTINYPATPSVSPSTIIFPPGVSDVGNMTIKSNTTYYFAGGSYVRGSFSGSDLQNVVFRGRGIISGEQYPYTGQGPITLLMNSVTKLSTNLVVDGITLIQTPFYGIQLAGANTIARNNKLIAWNWNTDGISVGSSGLIENNFLKVNDDATKLSSNSVSTGNVFWQGPNASTQLIGVNRDAATNTIWAHDNIILRTEHVILGLYNSIVAANQGGSGILNNYLIENMTVEDVNYKLFYLAVQSNPYTNPPNKPAIGGLKDMVFNNITVRNNMSTKSLISGNPSGTNCVNLPCISNIKFTGLTIGGTPVTDVNKANYFDIDPGTTSNITFQ